MRHFSVVLGLLVGGVGLAGLGVNRDGQSPIAVADRTRSTLFHAQAPAQEAPGSLAPPQPMAPLSAAPASLLQASLDPLVRRTGTAQWGVLAVSLERGDTLYAHAPQALLAPASNLKIMTAAAALLYLGPEHRFRTFLMTDGTVDDGVLQGSVYLYGTGDPTLGRRFQPRPAAVLEAFADSLVALGVTRITGDVVGDGSYFQGSGTGDGWRPDYMNNWYAASAGALSVHENLVRIEVRPGEQAGWRPSVTFVPGGRGVSIANLATTGGGGGISARRHHYDGPIVLEGRIGGGTAAFAVPIGDPARFAAALFRDVLASRQIALDGGIRDITLAEHSPVTGRRVHAPEFEEVAPVQVLAVHLSPPLRDILAVINQQSHNFYSEQVLRAVGRAAGGDGSAEAGARALLQILQQAGADTTGIHIVDGCGLSPLNRVSAGAFVSMLSYIARSPMAAEFDATLPVAGEIRRFRRMGGTAAGGNLRAKTGTINHVSALSGYVTARNGETIVFSIISNDVASTAHSKHVENLIGIRLAEFTR